MTNAQVVPVLKISTFVEMTKVQISPYVEMTNAQVVPVLSITNEAR